MVRFFNFFSQPFWYFFYVCMYVCLRCVYVDVTSGHLSDLSVLLHNFFSPSYQDLMFSFFFFADTSSDTKRRGKKKSAENKHVAAQGH